MDRGDIGSSDQLPGADMRNEVSDLQACQRAGPSVSQLRDNQAAYLILGLDRLANVACRICYSQSQCCHPCIRATRQRRMALSCHVLKANFTYGLSHTLRVRRPA